MAKRVVTLTTDFGLRDAYVGVMKGVILGIAPDVHLVDISNLVPPQEVGGGGYVLLSAYRYFPPGTIHLGVVDPGVGTSRRPIAVRTDRATFVGPDNGLFSLALADQGAIDRETGKLNAIAVEVTESAYRAERVSQTFHGRDIFAPAAGHLAAGLPIERLGRRLERIEVLKNVAPRIIAGQIEGRIIWIDHFGNAISNIPGSLLSKQPMITIGETILIGVASSYQEAELAPIVGSGGLLEIAARNGSAARLLDVKTGDPITVREKT